MGRMPRELFVTLALIAGALLLLFFGGRKRGPKRRPSNNEIEMGGPLLLGWALFLFGLVRLVECCGN
jgi:hypothetical protein